MRSGPVAGFLTSFNCKIASEMEIRVVMKMTCKVWCIFCVNCFKYLTSKFNHYLWTRTCGHQFWCFRHALTERRLKWRHSDEENSPSRHRRCFRHQTRGRQLGGRVTLAASPAGVFPRDHCDEIKLSQFSQIFLGQKKIKYLPLIGVTVSKALGKRVAGNFELSDLKKKRKKVPLFSSVVRVIQN